MNKVENPTVDPLRSRTTHSLMKFLCGKFRSEEGGSLVEMALSMVALSTVLFGVIQFSISFYAYNLAAEAAREATRYAAIRGTNSCTYATSTFPDCNLGPDSAGSTAAASTALQNYLQNRKFPFASNITVAASWWSPNDRSTGAAATWTMSCNAASDPNTTSPLYGDACNFPGHAVKVDVTLAYPLAIPFVPADTLNLHSTSQMVISE